MNITQRCFILFYIFAQTTIAYDAPKATLRIKDRGRARSFLDTYPSDSPSTPLALYKSPRLSKTGVLAAYNALLENTLQPSEGLFPSFSEEIDHLQRFWDTYHATNLSSDIRSEMGEGDCLHLNVSHIFRPKLHTQDGFIKVHGFHHDPDRILEKSGLFSIESKTLYTNGSYDQKFSTLTHPGISAKKTFFPESWNRQETLNALLFALKNAKKCDSYEDDENKEFTGTAPTTPPTPITIRIRILPGKVCISTAHPKH